MGISNMEVKKQNKINVLKYMLKADAVPIKAAAMALNLSVPTVTQCLNELAMLGLMEECGALDSQGGRKAMSYQAMKDAKLAIGIDLTTNHVNIVIINLSKEVRYNVRLRFHLKNDENSFQELRSIIEEEIKKSGIEEEKILGIGCSLPAIIDESGTKILGREEDFDISYDFYEKISKWFSCPVVLGNDATCAALSEVEMQDIDTFIYYMVSQTVGGAIILSGKPFRGISQRAGEFGHITMIKDGKECYCGRKGCVNGYCSIKQLSDMADGKIEDFFKKVEKKELQFVAAWEEYLDYLALSIHDIMMVMDADIIIGGYISKYIGPYMEYLKGKITAIDGYLSEYPFIRQSKLGYEAAAIGTASLFVNDYIDHM
ncbi:MAG: ROK family protein [Lachnospiraceae bacterium]|nr:ROK family protein [Lachnospiraceae bacterium]